MSEAAGRGSTALVTGVSALVSGATGFLGGRLAVALEGQGYQVRALARPTSDVSRLLSLGIEIMTGDLADGDSLARASAGQRVVFHTAGRVGDWGKAGEFRRANLEGTAAVIAACRKNRVRRLVHVSSLSVLGLPRHGAPVDEETPLAARPGDAYTASKIAGEELVRRAHGQDGLETVVVRSGVIWGPGDATFLPRFAALLRRGKMVLVGGGRNRIALSHVDNLVQGMILAASVPAAAGQVYHLTDGEEITAAEAFRLLAAALGFAPPRRSLPFAAAFAAASLLEAWARLRRRSTPPAFTRYGVRLVASDCRYEIGKARRELGYRPAITFRQGVGALAAAETHS
ncbi:MAG: NAD-dependent epimerase/dehydratase family protein [Desulfobacterales bacterium]|nr:NAD-dependent epimerase/dehydratase family protein [Desulfobacterales bacterium]